MSSLCLRSLHNQKYKSYCSLCHILEFDFSHLLLTSMVFNIPHNHLAMILCSYVLHILVRYSYC
ncbi:unnamed protein product [Moneuplotes crassus]|uniref:Uncharacterized protein n=1 Tax=Euplotes crassus TaxID=5936 RepID=A0AAD2D1W3_EUPCR|nr:unnamed protein product [Moneuplotes crassus]